MAAKKNSKKAIAAGVMDTILDACGSTAAFSQPVLATPARDAISSPSRLVDKSYGAGDLLSATFLPPSIEETEASEKIARLEENLAAAIAKNSELVDKLAVYVSENSSADAQIEAANNRATKAIAAQKKLESEKKNLEKALSAVEADAEELRELLQAKTAFDQLKEADATLYTQPASKLRASKDSKPDAKRVKWRPLNSFLGRYKSNGYEGWN